MNLIGDEYLGLKISNNAVALSALTPADINDNYLESLNDEDHMKYSRHSGKMHSFASQVSFIESSKRRGDSLFKISTTNSNEFCGGLSVTPDFKSKMLSLNLLIFRNYSGLGYGFHAMKAMCEYLDSRLIAFEQIIGTNIENIAMQNIAKKLDFVEFKSEDLSESCLVYFKRNEHAKSVYDFLPEEFGDAKQIYVASCDAGAANQLHELLGKLNSDYRMMLDGPAIRILANRGFNEIQSNDYRDILQCDLLLTGSGWMSSLERDAVKFARKCKVPSYCLLDHFVNYRSRFGDAPWEIPDGFLTTNKFAFKKAKEVWATHGHYQIPDFQIARIQERIFSRLNSGLIGLFVLDLVSNDNAATYIESTINAVKQIKCRYSNDVVIQFRLHPAQHDPDLLISQLKSIIGGSPSFSNSSLEDDLIRSRFVVGTNSYALYIANSVGLKTYITNLNESNEWITEIPGFDLLETPK